MNSAASNPAVSQAGSAAGRRPRLAIVVSHPIQHFGPMYRCIAADGRVELLVIFAESGAGPRFDSGFGRVVSWQDDLLEGYEHTFVTVPEKERSAAVVAKLDEFAPDVVYVHGYSLDYLRKAMSWAQAHKAPVLITTDSELRHERPLHVRMVKRLVLPPVLRKVDLFLTVGDENERYFAHYGVPKERFHRTGFSIDSGFYDRVLADPAAVRQRVRAELNIPDDAVVLLTVGKLIPRKGQADLVRAFGIARAQLDRPAVLLLAGDGPERPALTALAEDMENSVRLLGFIGVDKLPEYYTAADVYVHPSSHDPHPLAISEALYCGLPVAVSDRVGSIGETDDVQVGRNGWVYPDGDVQALARMLVELIQDAPGRERASRLSRELGLTHAADRCATRFVDGALLALERKRAGR